MSVILHSPFYLFCSPQIFFSPLIFWIINDNFQHLLCNEDKLVAVPFQTKQNLHWLKLLKKWKWLLRNKSPRSLNEQSYLNKQTKISSWEILFLLYNEIQSNCFHWNYAFNGLTVLMLTSHFQIECIASIFFQYLAELEPCECVCSIQSNVKE